MLFLLSPAKSLDYDSPLPVSLSESDATAPQFPRQTQALIALLRQKSVQEIATLMSLSDKLAALNVARYASFSTHHTPDNARPAALAFNGDVYEGLQAASFSRADWVWAQQHLIILSGLYGVLRPLDWMQPHRLEMGTRLATPQGATLYQFWGSSITEQLNQALSGQAEPVVVNLASREYFKSVQPRALKARVVECVFEDCKGGQYKVVSFFAKRARGLMARWAVTQRVARPEQLHAFDSEGYAYTPSSSTPARLVFRREAQA